MTTASAPTLDARLPAGWKKTALVILVLYALSLETGIFAPQVIAGAGALVVLYCALKRYLPLPGRQFAGLALGFALLANIASALASPWPLHSLKYVFADYGFPLTGLFVVLWLAREPRRLRVAFHTLVLAGALGGAYGIFQFFTGADPLYGKSIHGPIREITRFDLYAPIGLLNNSLTYTGIQMTILLLALPAAWRSRGRRALLLWGAIFLMLFSIYAPLKRSPMIGLALGAAVFFCQLGRKAALRFTLAGAAALILLVVLAPGMRNRLDVTLQMGTQSETDRVCLWRGAANMGLAHPLLGIGPGNWPKVADDYLPEHDYFSTAHAHSDPMHLWATTGALGSLGALLVFLALMWRGVKSLRRDRRPSTERDILLGSLLALLGFAAASFFQCYLIDGENALVLGCVIGLGLASQELLMLHLSGEPTQ